VADPRDDPAEPSSGRFNRRVLRTLLDQHTDHIAIVGTDGRFLFSNHASKRLFGWAPDELVGRDAFAFVHPEDLPSVRSAFAEAVTRPGQRLVREYRVRCQDGGYRAVEGAAIDLSRDNEVGGVVLAVRDITDRTRVESELAAQRDHLDRQLRYAHALNRMAQAIGDLEGSKAVLDALVRIIGEVLGLDRCLILDVDITKKFALGLSEWLDPENPEAFSIKRDYPLSVFPDSLKHLWGRRTTIESHAHAHGVPLASEGSAPYVHGELKIRSLLWFPCCFRADGFFLLALNQVSRARAWTADEAEFVDAAAKQVNLALQKRAIISERSAVEERLRQSQKMEAIGKLAGGVAHDFNNLLTAIIGYADLLTQKIPAEDPLRRYAEGIMQVSRRASETTHQLLAFSRRQVLKPRILKLNALITGLEQLLRRLIGEDIQLEVSLDASVGRVRVDPGQLELALVNLAVNARDAMPDGGVLGMATLLERIDGEHARRSNLAPGDYACIRVSDTGVGMDDETLSHLFEPFFTTKALGKGTGLGLSSVYGIISSAGGSVQVASKPGAGTVFALYLPLDHNLENTPIEGQAIIPASGGAETVLMVEDDDTLRELLGDALSERGYRVLSASDGAEALRIAGDHAAHIDLLLSDVVMPRMTGPVLARRLLEARPRTRVLFMSGYTADAFAADPDLSKAPVITKPFTIDDLARTVRDVIDGVRR
jgi:two-component system, cell cycle sensor histidine kinase and response regulator CckA